MNFEASLLIFVKNIINSARKVINMGKSDEFSKNFTFRKVINFQNNMHK